MKKKLLPILLKIGARTDIIGWVLVGWPIFFLFYNEIYREGLENLTWAEIFAYGVPIFTLPLLGHLIKILVRHEEYLSKTKRYLGNVIDNMADILVIIDRNKRIVFGNAMLKKHFGDVIGQKCHELFEGLQWPCPDCPEEGYINRGRGVRVRRRRTIFTHKERWFEISKNPFKDQDGQIIGIVEIWRDINAQVQLEESLKELALTDGLTGLYNSRSFFRNFPQEMKRARRQGYSLALLMFDIDNFKKYNDKYGHPAGDKVLRHLGTIIRDSIRNDVDSGYRYGGDEFAIVLPYLTMEEARGVAERILKTFLENEFLLVSLSIGLLIMEKGFTMHQMVNLADSAMYKAKDLGGNQIYVHGT